MSEVPPVQQPSDGLWLRVVKVEANGVLVHNTYACLPNDLLAGHHLANDRKL